ncbi:MAG: PAS domain S-box protein, partial [Deltaproteobacteria bacterium]|nr:PAS domain S-box protein [Deltaproteobacteria bacterium]
LEKVDLCVECEVFCVNMDLAAMGESFKAISGKFLQTRNALEARDRELENISLEMALGLSEVFEALKKISFGDPMVRIPEESSLELISKLKELVNKTAENLGEMVDLSHEFAMGLAEHFDVLHRVTRGDLMARVRGESNIELLESFKNVTNQMIGSVDEEINERKQATADLKGSEEKYRSLIESIQDGVYIIKNDRFMFVNDAFAKIVGYPLDEVIGMEYQALIAPEDLDRVAEHYRLRQAGESVEKGYEFRMVHKDGKTTVYVNLSAGATTYKDQTAVIGTLKDITERKLADMEKQELEIRLQRSEKMEAIGTLAGGVAHDLNNILSGIVTYPEFLLMDLPEESPLRKPLFTIQKSGEKAAAIVQDLLTLARRGVASKEVVDLNRVVTEYLRSPEYRMLLSFHPGIEIETRPVDDLLYIMGSQVHISKTVMNLISNAVEAIPDGGKVRVSMENRYIDSPMKGFDHVRKEGDYVVLTVADSGVGISPQDMKQIFEPFYTKKVMGRSGTGLGMAVVWGTVKDHGGYIDVQSHEGKGTVFTLYFPASREGLSGEKLTVSIEDCRGNGESVLVVDDVEEQRTIATAILSMLGYHGVAVSSGEDAVAYIKENRVDLLVLDMIMGTGMDGLETFREIIKWKPGQKTIIASGFSETSRVKEAQRLGAGGYVKKPYSLEKIGFAVRKELDKPARS